jgi:hypothetical protein
MSVYKVAFESTKRVRADLDAFSTCSSPPPLSLVAAPLAPVLVETYLPTYSLDFSHAPLLSVPLKRLLPTFPSPKIPLPPFNPTKPVLPHIPVLYSSRLQMVHMISLQASRIARRAKAPNRQEGQPMGPSTLPPPSFLTSPVQQLIRFLSVSVVSASHIPPPHANPSRRRPSEPPSGPPSTRPTRLTRSVPSVTSTRPPPLEDLPTPRVSSSRRSESRPSSPTPPSESASESSSSRTERRSPLSFPMTVAS